MAFASNQDQLTLLHANHMALKMPTVGCFFLVWQYQWYNKSVCTTQRSTLESLAVIMQPDTVLPPKMESEASNVVVQEKLLLALAQLP